MRKDIDELHRVDDKGMFVAVLMALFRLGAGPVAAVFGVGSVIFFISSGLPGIILWFLFFGPVIASLSLLAWLVVCTTIAGIATAFGALDDAIRSGKGVWPWKWFWKLGWQEKLGYSIFLLVCLVAVLAVTGAMFGNEEGNGDRSVLGKEAVAPSATPGSPRPIVTPGPSPTRRPTSTPRPTAAPPYKLALVSAACVRPIESYVECEGFVENLTKETMENVVAVIVYTDANGTPLASDDALIAYNPIFPGQQSPWSVIGTWNPRYDKWRVEFKELFGGSILTNYDAIR